MPDGALYEIEGKRRTKRGKREQKYKGVKQVRGGGGKIRGRGRGEKNMKKEVT